jgi:hypothetical protein
MYQHLPLEDPPKFTQIGIFGWKTCHLATLLDTIVPKSQPPAVHRQFPGFGVVPIFTFFFFFSLLSQIRVTR